MISVFVSYSHKDEELQNQLQIHLSLLKREKVIDVWHDRRIESGDHVDNTISDALERAHIILLLVSPDFIASDYCYEKEMQRALQLHGTGEATVLPVILRPCDWTHAPFGELRASPKDGRPVVKWPNVDDAFLDVVRDIRRAIKAITPAIENPSRDSVTGAPVANGEPVVDADVAPGIDTPRPSNLRIRKSFTEADKDRFLKRAFGYVSTFMENSLRELEERFEDVETSFTQVDARQFTATIYRSGDALSRCRVFLGGFGRGVDSICYSTNDSGHDNSFNESLSVEVGEQMLGLRSLGLGNVSGERSVLSLEGAAEFYWGKLIEPLQR